jgi:hypothetical protein
MGTPEMANLAEIGQQAMELQKRFYGNGKVELSPLSYRFFSEWKKTPFPPFPAGEERRFRAAVPRRD